MIIKTEEEFEKALGRIGKLFDITEDSPDWVEFCELCDAIATYKDENYEIIP